MKTALSWLLWLWLSLVIVGAFFYAPAGKDFIGESSRILFFHVPLAWVSFLAFLAAGFWSLLFLARGRAPRHDRAAAAAVELGLLYGFLATVTGALWARVEWGAYWNWDPRQIYIVIALCFYGAYLILRSAIEDADTRARLSAAYAALGLVVTPFLFFILPRMAKFSLHPQPVVNAEGKADMDPRMLLVLLAALTGFTALFFWMHNLRCRLAALAERKSAPLD